MIGVVVKNFLRDLEGQSFSRFSALFFGVVLVFVAALFAYYYYAVSGLERKMRRVNQQREEARVILQEHALVQKQRAEVDAILAKEKDFRIAQYFPSIVSELGLTKDVSKEPATTQHDLNNGYSETQLDAGFKELDMKQVAELLYKIEQNDRVYTKNIMILKPPKASKLDVTLTIATLQPKTE